MCTTRGGLGAQRRHVLCGIGALYVLLSLPAEPIAAGTGGDLAAFAVSRPASLLLSPSICLRGTDRASHLQEHGATRVRASSVRIDHLRQGSGGPGFRQGSGLGGGDSFKQGSGGVPAVATPSVRVLPSGSLAEQREKLNQMHLEREAWYDLMRRKVRASSYQDGIQDIRRLFSQFDTNKNGALDWTEYRALLMRMGLRPFYITDDDLRILFYEMGANGRGIEVRAREFFAWFSGSSAASVAGRVRRSSALAESAVTSLAPRGLGEPAGVSTAALSVADAGWTYGESIWWDEGPETRVLKTMSDPGALTFRQPAAADTMTVAVDGTRTDPRLSVLSDVGHENDGCGAEADGDSLQPLVEEVAPWTAATPDQLQASVYFLVNEIGLPASKVKALALEVPEVFCLPVDAVLRPRVDSLRQIGVPLSKLAKLLSACPDMLEAEGWARRQNSIDFLGELGIPQERLGACLVRYPRVLDGNVEAMTSVVEFLVGVGRIPRAKVGKIVEAMPSLLSHNVERNLRPKLEFLLDEVGISPQGMAAVLLKFPQVLGLSVNCNLRPTVRYLTQDIGVAHQDLRRILTSMPQLLGLSVEANLKVKAHYLECELGIPHERLADVVTKAPALLSLSVEKNLRPKVCFLVEEAGYNVDEVIRTPNVLAYSMDRMRSRHEFLRGKGLRLGLASMLSYSNTDFQRRFDHDGDLL